MLRILLINKIIDKSFSVPNDIYIRNSQLLTSQFLGLCLNNIIYSVWKNREETEKISKTVQINSTGLAGCNFTSKFLATEGFSE